MGDQSKMGLESCLVEFWVRTVVVDLVTAAHSRGHSRSHSRSHSRGTAVRQGELEEGRNLGALSPGLRRRMKA